jgi:hypothetical protein
MLLVILTVLFIVVVVVAFAFSVGVFAIGTGQVVAGKIKGERTDLSRNAIVQRIANEAARKAVREQMICRPYSPAVGTETPEEKGAREKREARRRYLDSLVDR